mmetsp:Transcript_47494/g.75100  ORF Transcript_47494/g.75100 Transcript_47494/m.75100 type:complete len:279 (+) Transcript_47494:284-1120(+)
MKTTPFCSRLTARMAASVMRSHPMLLCERGFPSSTVRTELRSNTPCCDHEVRSPCGHGQFPASFSIFIRLGGTLTPRGTEKDRPIAWPLPWYGSWPTITTRTFSNGVTRNALKTSSSGGNMVSGYFSRARATSFMQDSIEGLRNSASKAAYHPAPSRGSHVSRIASFRLDSDAFSTSAVDLSISEEPADGVVEESIWAMAAGFRTIIESNDVCFMGVATPLPSAFSVRARLTGASGVRVRSRTSTSPDPAAGRAAAMTALVPHRDKAETRPDWKNILL